MTSHALILFRGKFLVILRDNKPNIPYPNLWAPLGGNAFMNEAPEETLRRELKEEANLEEEDSAYLGDMDLDSHLFLVKISGKNFKRLKKGSEGQKLGFFDFEQLLKLNLVTKFRNFLEKNQSEIKKAIRNL